MSDKFEVKFSTEKPVVYDRLHQAFGVEWDKGLIIAYAPLIYCKGQVPPEKIVHEMVHIKEQLKMGVELWYDLYIGKDSFRLEEEVKAYREEVQFLKRHVRDRELVFQMKHDIAKNLASEIYGNIISYDRAMKLIS